MTKKIKNILGLTILEAIISTAIVGIGFVAILSMVNYSVQSIDTSGERTKANYLVSMMAEDVIGHKDSIYGVNTNEKVVIGIDGTITVDGIEQPEARKFSDHSLLLKWEGNDDIPHNPILLMALLWIVKQRRKLLHMICCWK